MFFFIFIYFVWGGTWVYSWCVGVGTQMPVCVWQSEDNRTESFLSIHLTRLLGITLKCQDLHSQHLYPMINLTDL